MFDSYKNSLKDVIDSNINDEIPSKNNSLKPSKSSVLAFWSKKAILSPFWDQSNIYK